jgi:hypothetical protein
MCLCQIGEPYILVLPRVISFGPLSPSHTSESTFPRQHCAMRLIDVRDLVRDINENVHSASPIPDPPTEKETQWDVLALDMIRFRAFKGLINTKSRISFYLVRQSTWSFEITDRPHHPACLRHQPTMNLSYRDSVTDLF